MTEILGAIDMGTHTTRLLTARAEGLAGRLVFLERRRAYTRLGEDFDRTGERVLSDAAMDRALEEITGMKRRLDEAGAARVRAVATGVVREARNRDAFLSRIRDRTGIRVRCVTGEEEAGLTAKGVRHALGRPRGEALLFDLGGGSTEFVTTSDTTRRTVRSIPLGAVLLTNMFLAQDPPARPAIEQLLSHVDACLEKLPRYGSDARGRLEVVGTGGTATTLAAMLHHIPVGEISPERMNGLRIGRADLSGLFNRIRELPFSGRVRLEGLDEGRARVIVAGAAAVLGIMTHAGAEELTVCLSDLLEGMLIEAIEGEEDG